jgi:hypothetical protein
VTLGIALAGFVATGPPHWRARFRLSRLHLGWRVNPQACRHQSAEGAAPGWLGIRPPERT